MKALPSSHQPSIFAQRCRTRPVCGGVQLQAKGRLLKVVLLLLLGQELAVAWSYHGPVAPGSQLFELPQFTCVCGGLDLCAAALLPNALPSA